MTSPVAKITDELEAKAAAFVKEHRLPGAAVGVVHGDDLVWSAGVGFADVASRRPPDDLDAVPDRVDHQDVHRHGDHAAPRRGAPAPGRSDRGVRAGAAGRGEPVRTDRDRHDPPDALARVGPRRRPTGNGLVDAAGLRRPDRAQPGAGRRDRHARPAEHAAEVLEHRVSVARRGRDARDRRAVRGSRALGDPRAARHDEHPLRAGAGRQRSPAVPPGTTRGGSPTSSHWPTCRSRSGPRAACGRASRTWRGGSRSSSARTEDRATARRCWRVPP